jgi:hypothetical protein
VAQPTHGMQYSAMEWHLTAEPHCERPPAELELDVLVTHDSGATWRVPAFWAGGRDWWVRFAPPKPGHYRWKSECRGAKDEWLHGREGDLEAAPAKSETPLLRHGPIRVSANGRRFEHEDGTRFLWLGDTWWMGLTKRLHWPDDFQRLTGDRVAKGFTVVQIVAGLYPDMDWHDPRGENEAGFPYSKDFSEPNPAYFANADVRICHLVRAGLVPCIVACWGYYLPWAGEEKLKRHWRNLIARWGAYPVVWCLAGEGTMPYYLSETKDADKKRQREGWTEIARYVRSIDPMRRPITIHPTDVGRDQVTDPSVLDFDMLQTGHSGYDSIPNTVNLMTACVARTPTMPVVDGEVDYEGFLHGNYDEVQRMAFWSCMLSGAAGHTYGANGIWQVNTREQPYGASPHGNTWGHRPWDEAMALPGSAQLGIGKHILLKHGWPDIEPHQEWIEPSANEKNRWGPYAAGIPKRLRIIYSYQLVWGRSQRVKGIEPGVAYRAKFINPSTGVEHDLGAVQPEADGSWLVPQQPELRDWVLILSA